MKYLLSTLSLITLVSLSSNLFAGIPPTATADLQGINGQVNVLEVEDLSRDVFSADTTAGDLIPLTGHYLVDVLNPTVNIHAIAISQNSGDMGTFQDFDITFWASTYISEADWNSNTGSPLWLNTAAFNFDSLFGSIDTGVNFYYLTDSVLFFSLNDGNDNDNPVAADIYSFPGAYFHFGSDLASNFAAFSRPFAPFLSASEDTANALLVDQSFQNTQIPTPMPLLLIAAGLFGLAQLRRR